MSLEAVVRRHEQHLAAWCDLGQALLAAAVVRDAVSDALDEVADQRERDRDLTKLVAPADHRSYGADWPARRDAALHRAHSQSDRLAAREDLIALVGACRFPPLSGPNHDDTDGAVLRQPPTET